MASASALLADDDGIELLIERLERHLQRTAERA